MRFTRVLFWSLFPTLFWAFSLPAQNFHTPAEILRMLDESSLTYSLLEAEDTPLPLQKGRLNSPFTVPVRTRGRLMLEDFPLSDSAADRHNRAFHAFRDQDFARARDLWNDVLEEHPDCAVPMGFLGRTAFLTGDLDMAKQWLAKAVHTNFYDFHAHWFLAKTLHAERQFTRAAEEISIALVLNRNHKEILTDLQTIFRAAKLRWQDVDFFPNYHIEKEGTEVKIAFAKDYMMYALTKAVWAHEPGHRRKYGSGDEHFDMNEEKECLLNLVLAHEKLNGGRKSKVPAIQQLIRAMAADHTNAFIFFEKWLIEEPLIALTQPQEGVEKIAEYVREIRGKKK